MPKKKSNFIAINASEQGRLIFVLVQGEIIQQQIFSVHKLDEVLLSCLDRLMRKYKVRWSEISSLGVVNRGGSFASLRLALACINTLAWVNQIPIIALTAEQFAGLTVGKLLTIPNKQRKKFKAVLPAYDRPPLITLSKKKPHFIKV